MFNFWWSVEQSWAKNINQKTKKTQKCPLSHRKIKCLFLDYIQLLMIGWVIWAKNVDRNVNKWKRPPKSSKNKMFIFGLGSTSDDWPGWSMDWIPSATPLQPKKWNAHFWIMFNFWWSAGLVDGLEPHLPPLSSQKNEMLIFGLCSTSDDLARLVDGLEPHLPLPLQPKNEMLIFGLRSTSDDRLRDLSKKHQPKCKKTKKAP